MRLRSMLALAGGTLLTVTGCATVPVIEGGRSLGGLPTREAAAPSDPRLDEGRSTVVALGDDMVRLDAPIEGDGDKLAVWFHGQGGDENQRMNEDWLNALREDGWYVAAGTTGRNGWGNATSVEAGYNLVKWAEAETGRLADLFIAGSMGATTSLGLLAAYDVRPKCWYGVMPVTDLTTVGNVPRSADQIADAWGEDVASSPLDLVAQLPIDIDYRVRYSPDDTWVPGSANGERLLVSLAAAGASASFSLAEGEHGDPSHFDVDDLIAFAEACASLEGSLAENQ